MANRARGTGLLVMFGVLVAAGNARAACNVVTPSLSVFPSTLGSTDRPFARPGDWVGLTLDPACGASPAFAPDDVITVVFTPPGGGTRNAVVHQASCVGFEGNPAQAACQAQLGSGGRAFCAPLSGGPQTNVIIPNPQTL